MEKYKKSLIGIILAISLLVGIVPFAGNNNIASVEASTKSTNKKAMAAYKKLLSKSKLRWMSDYVYSTSQIKFTCLDINRDGVKELLLYNQNASHYEGWERVYVYSQGKVRSLGNFTSLSFYPKKKYFTNSYSGRGTWETKYYALTKSGKKLVKKASYMVSDTRGACHGKVTKKKNMYGYYDYYHSFTVNGKKSTYKKCFTVIKKLEKGAKEASIRYHKNTAANRKKYLK